MSPLDVVTIETPSLGDRSYVAVAEGRAVVIDPQRDIDRVLAVLARTGARVTHVLETHIHNDYVSGGLELARRTGAEYCVAAADDVAFRRRPVAPGDVVTAGPMTVRVVATPGHTPTHLGYVLDVDGRERAVFSGGSLLYGTVGRTDLIGAELARQLAVAQFASARRLLADLPTDAVVYPTHGFGSFCASIAPSEDGPAPELPVHTIGAERAGNVVMAFEDAEEFADHLIAGLGAYPRYYAHMGPLNRSGPQPLDLSPAPAAAAEQLPRRVEAGEWVVDTRSRHAYAAGHLRGTVGIELGDSFATYLGWLIPWGTPVTLVGDDEEAVAEAQRMMARIGIDRPRGRFTGAPAGGSSYEVVRWEDLVPRIGEVDVVDVRRVEEWEESHVAGAANVPLHELQERIDALPDGELWVHCRTGYRASIACSLLSRAGRSGVLVDDEWSRAAAAGVPVE